MISDLVIPTPLTNICYFDGKDNNFQFRVILLIIFIFNVSCIYVCWHNKIMPL